MTLVLIFVNAIAFCLPVALSCLSIHVSLRGLRYPDLGLIGCYLAGVYGYSIPASQSDLGWLPGIFLGPLLGALGGTCTGLLHYRLRVNSLLAGVVTIFIVRGSVARLALSQSSDYAPTSIVKIPSQYGLNQILWEWSLGLAEAMGFAEVRLPVFQAAISIVVLGFGAALLSVMLRSRLGVALRAVGEDRNLAISVSLPVRNLGVLGLAMAGGIAGAGGVTLMFLNTQASLESSHLILIEAFAAYFLGLTLLETFEQQDLWYRWGPMVILSLGGPVVYFLLRNGTQVAATRVGWLVPTDYNLAFASVLIIAVGVFRLVTERVVQKPITIY